MPLELPVACTLKVVSATPGKQTFELNNQNWGGDAKLTGGMWTLTTNKAEGFRCPCGQPAGMTKQPFTLAFSEPLPIPVDRYPLVCEPAGMRLCR